MPARESWSRIRSDDQESTEVRSVRVAPLACLAHRRVQARALEGYCGCPRTLKWLSQRYAPW